MHWASPIYLNFLLLVPALVIFFIFVSISKRRSLDAFGERRIIERLSVSKSIVKERTKRILIIIIPRFSSPESRKIIIRNKCLWSSGINFNSIDKYPAITIIMGYYEMIPVSRWYIYYYWKSRWAITIRIINAYFSVTYILKEVIPCLRPKLVYYSWCW